MTASSDKIAVEQWVLANLPMNATAKIEKRKAGITSGGERLQEWTTLASAQSISMGAKSATIQSIAAGQRELVSFSATLSFISGLDVSCRFTIAGKIYNVKSVLPSFAGVYQTAQLVEEANGD